MTKDVIRFWLWNFKCPHVMVWMEDSNRIAKDISTEYFLNTLNLTSLYSYGPTDAQRMSYVLYFLV